MRASCGKANKLTHFLRIGYEEKELSSWKGRSRDGQRLLRDQRRAGDMRPGQAGEVEKH